MKRNHLPSLLLVVLALGLVSTAAQAASGAPAPPAAPQASVAPPAAASATPAVTALSTPAWSPAILAGIPAPGEMKSEVPLPFLPPSFCPPPCIGCFAPHRCAAPCQVNMGCTICSCV
jgi:hypothetical protein